MAINLMNTKYVMPQLAVFLLSIMTQACVSPPARILPSVRSMGTEATGEGETLKADVGSVFLEHSRLSLLPAIQVLEAYRLEGSKDIIIPEQFAIAYWDKSRERRFTLQLAVEPKNGEIRDTIFPNVALDVLLSHLDGSPGYADTPIAHIHGNWIEPNVSRAGLRSINEYLSTFPVQWSFTEHQSEHDDNFKQTLTYLGHEEDSIRVLYQEFSQDMIRDKFSLEIDYDLTEDAVFGFRGARIEVIRADNRSIEYRVLQPFPALAPSVEKADF